MADKKTQQEHQRYQQLAQDLTPRPKVFRNTVLAFLVGGLICVLGQAILDYFSTVEPTKDEASAVTLAAMIVLASIATGLGVYDWVAEIGGMGAAVPITGFSNTVTAAAMDFKREGYILGMASKMFIIAGPIIVYGIISGFIVGFFKAAAQGLFQ